MTDKSARERTSDNVYITATELAFARCKIEMEQIYKEPDPMKRELLYLRAVAAREKTIEALKSARDED